MHALHDGSGNDTLRSRGAPNERAGTRGPASQKGARVISVERRVHFDSTRAKVDKDSACSQVTERPSHTERSRRGVSLFTNQDEVRRKPG
jgi:hypothetical protein